MPHAIALLPWVHCREMLTVGPLRILPYAYGQVPGRLPNADQADIDAIFGAYAIRPNVFVKQASIVEFAGWQTGMDVEAADNAALFRARDALAFAALAKRQLFRGHFNYTNSDMKRLADDGRLSLDVADEEQLGTLEELLFIDPLSPAALSRMDDSSHPWSEFKFSARFLARARRWQMQSNSDNSAQ
jgi:hypothetical protein